MASTSTSIITKSLPINANTQLQTGSFISFPGTVGNVVASGATTGLNNTTNIGNGPSTIKAITLNNQIGTQLTFGDSPSIVSGTVTPNSSTAQIISRKLNAPMASTSNKIIVQSLPINTNTSAALGSSGAQLSTNATITPSASLMNTNNTSFNNIFRNFLSSSSSSATAAAVAAQALINNGTSGGNVNNNYSSTSSTSTANAADAVKVAATIYNNLINMNNSNINSANSINLTNNNSNNNNVGSIGQGVNTITLAPTPASASSNSNATTTITLSTSIPSSSSSAALTGVNQKLISNIQANNGNSVANILTSSQSSPNIAIFSGSGTSTTGPSKLVINPTSNTLLLQQQQQNRIMGGNSAHPSIIGLTGSNTNASITTGTPLLASGAQFDSATSSSINTNNTFNLNPASNITKATIPINLKGNTIIPLTVASSPGTSAATSSTINGPVSIASSPSNASSINLKSISSTSATGLFSRASQTPPPQMTGSSISSQQAGSNNTSVISSIQFNGNKPISNFQNLQLINSLVSTISAAASHQQGLTNFNNLVNQINQSQNSNSISNSLLQPLQPMRLVANLNSSTPIATVTAQNLPEKATSAVSASTISSQNHSASTSSPSSSPLKPNIIRKSRFVLFYEDLYCFKLNKNLLKIMR
jgi:trimeric autotransporter adhesin